jgi:hypothetical protein
VENLPFQYDASDDVEPHLDKLFLLYFRKTRFTQNRTSPYCTINKQKNVFKVPSLQNNSEFLE